MRLRQQQTTEAIALLDEAAEPDLGGAADVTEAAELAARGGTLDTRTLMQVERTIRAGVAARRALAGRDDLPALAELVAGIDLSLVSISDEIARTVEEDGSDLRDSASPALRRLRRELREGRGAPRREAPEDRARPRPERASPGRLRDGARGPSRVGAESVGARACARDRPRLVRLGPDALRRAARGRRGLEPPPRSRGSGARRGGADPPQPLVARRVPGRGAHDDRGGDGRARPRARPRDRLPRLARRPCDGEPTMSSLRGARHPLLDRASAVPIDLELGALRALVDQRPEHGRQDRGAEDARPRGAAPPVRPPSAGGRGGAPGLRRGAGRHRRRAVDRDEPLDVLGPRAQPRRDPRARDGALARPARRARGRHRPRRGRRAGAGPPRPAVRRRRAWCS